MKTTRVGYLKVYQVNRSRKQYKDDLTGGTIETGSKYYWWKWRYGDKQRSVNMPSNLDKYPHSVEKTFTSLVDRLQECVDNEEYDSDLIEEATQFVDERNEAIQNIEEYFSDGSVLDRLREMVEEVEDYINSIESYEE